MPKTKFEPKAFTATRGTFNLGVLRAVIREFDNLPEKTPIVVMSDEEGNGIGRLHTVAYEEGKIWMWPCDAPDLN